MGVNVFLNKCVGMCKYECKHVSKHGCNQCVNCHSPTQPQLELELDLIMGRNPPPTTTGTFKALPGNLGS